MALSADDMKIPLTVDPDIRRVEEALNAIGAEFAKSSGKNANVMSEMIMGMGEAGRAAAKEAAKLNTSWEEVSKKMGDCFKEQQEIVKQERLALSAANDKVAATREQLDILRQIGAIKEKEILSEKVGADSGQLDVIRKMRTVPEKVGATAEQLASMKKLNELAGMNKPGFWKGILNQVQKGMNVDWKQLAGAGVGAAGGSVMGGGGIGSAGLAGIGGMAGAAGGYVGLAIAGVMGGVGAAIAAFKIAIMAVKAPLEMVSSSFRELEGSLGPLGVATNMLPLFGSTVKDVLTSLIHMSSLANPAIFKQWQIALEDTQAVIGEAFLPVLVAMTSAVRTIGDAIASALPQGETLIKMMTPLSKSFKELGRSLASLLSDPTIIQFFVVELTGLVRALQWATEVFHALARMLTNNPIIRAMALAAGMPPLPPAGTPGASSVGAATRPAQMQSIEAYETALQLSAYSMSAAISPQQRTANATERMQAILERMERQQGAGGQIQERVNHAAGGG